MKMAGSGRELFPGQIVPKHAVMPFMQNSFAVGFSDTNLLCIVF